MTPAQLLIAHAVKVAILVVLAGLAARRRQWSCWSLTLYLVVALAGNCLTSFWPARFYTYYFYVTRQALFDVLKLVIALELAGKVFAAFPGAMSRWRAAVVVIVPVTALAVAIAGQSAGRGYVAFDWQPRVVAGAIWILTAIAVLVGWHRLPIDPWHHAILVGYVPYLLVLTSLLNLLRNMGWTAAATIGIVDSLAYLALMVWWSYAAWRPARVTLADILPAYHDRRWTTS